MLQTLREKQKYQITKKEGCDSLRKSKIRFLNPKKIRKWIDLFSKETQNPFSDSFGFKNPILDFLKETQPKITFGSRNPRNS